MGKITHRSVGVILLLIAGIGARPGGAEAQKGEAMEEFQVLVDGQLVEFSSPPVQVEGVWLVPLESFCRFIGAKVDYPTGADLAVVCQVDPEGHERCVPLPLDEGPTGARRIEGRVYASPLALAESLGYRVHQPTPQRMEWIREDFPPASENPGGFLAPDFTLPDLEGKLWRLRDFRGKKTLLYLWASW